MLDYADEMSETDKSFLRVYETSSKTGHNVETVFVDIATDYLNDPKNTLTEFNKALKLESESNKTSQKCCAAV